MGVGCGAKMLFADRGVGGSEGYHETGTVDASWDGILSKRVGEL